MCQGVAPILTSPCPFIPISGTLLLQFITGICIQEFLRGVGEGKDHNIFGSHQLLVELVILASASSPVNVESFGSGNALTKNKCRVKIISGFQYNKVYR